MMRKSAVLKQIIGGFILVIGLLLLSVNVYGIFKDIAPNNIEKKHLRFPQQEQISYAKAVEDIRWGQIDTEISYISRATNTISGRLAHIHWTKYEPSKFNQRVPIWENYLLFYMSKFTKIPEYKRYHFSNYKRSLKRGIGICGDASMVMSQLLDQNGFSNKIISFPGHVIVEVSTSSGEVYTSDPDFGVLMPYSISDIQQNPARIIDFYRAKGYSDRDINNLVKKYQLEFKEWDGVSHFITNKYYFEKAAYVAKWPLPVLLVFAGYLYIRQNSFFPKT